MQQLQNEKKAHTSKNWYLPICVMKQPTETYIVMCGHTLIGLKSKVLINEILALILLQKHRVLMKFMPFSASSMPRTIKYSAVILIAFSPPQANDLSPTALLSAPLTTGVNTQRKPYAINSPLLAKLTSTT